MLIWPRVQFASVIATTCVPRACVSPSTHIARRSGRYGFDRNRTRRVSDSLQHVPVVRFEQLGNKAEAFISPGTLLAQLTAVDLPRASAQTDDPKVSINVAHATAACGVLFGTPPLALS